MGRRWNRMKSALYTRIPWLAEAYVKVKGKRWEDSIALPQLVRLAHAVSDAKIGLLTSAGVHLNSHEPFDMGNPEGDATFRIIPAEAEVANLQITHDYYDHTAADRDVNCIFPIERLRELVLERTVGASAPRHVAFMGHISGCARQKLVEDTAGEIAEVFVNDRVDAVLASPG